MTEFRREMLWEVATEVEDLLQLHYEELTLNKDRVKLNPRWAHYRALEHAGAFIILTARDSGKLVGYSAFFLNRNMHYADLSVAHNDVLFLHPQYRAQPRTGLRLIQFSEAECRKEGAHKISFHAKLDTPLIKLLHSQGYKTEELMLGKFL